MSESELKPYFLLKHSTFLVRMQQRNVSTSSQREIFVLHCRCFGFRMKKGRMLLFYILECGEVRYEVISEWLEISTRKGAQFFGVDFLITKF